MRLFRRLFVVSFLLLIAVAVWGAIYAQHRGFSRTWRELVEAEFAKRGYYIDIGRLTLGPFQGLVAEDVIFFQDSQRKREIASVDNVILDLDLSQIVNRDLSVNTLDVQDAKLSLPLEPGKRDSETLEMEHLSARLAVTENQIEIVKAQAELKGVQLTVKGSLHRPAAVAGGEKKAETDPAEQKRKLSALGERVGQLRTVLDEIGRLEFDGGADPRIEVEFSGDLDSFAGMRAEARLSSGGFRRGSYRVEGLEGELTLDGAKDRAVLQTLQLRDEKGVVRIRAEWPLKTREIACEVESSIDAKALLGAIFPNPKLGEVVFYEAPKVKFEGVLNLDALAAYRAKLAEKVGSDEDASSGDGAAAGRADAAMRSLGDLPLSAIGEFRCDRFGSRGEVFDGLEFSFSVEGGRFYVRNLRLDHKTGVMFANLMYDPALGDETFRYQSEVKMDPRTFTPFLAGDEMKEFLSSWDFDENSTVYLAAFGSGPGLEASRWTSEGIVDLRNFRLNHVAFDRIEANYEARGAEQSYRNVRMVRPEGEVTAPALHHQVDRRLWRIEDLRWSLDLSEGLRAICPDVVDAVKAYRFSKPPRVVVNGVVDARKTPGASPRAGRKHEFELDFESDEPVEYEMLGKTLSLGRPRGALKFVGDTVHLTDFTADLFGGEVNAGYLFDVTDPERRFEATVSLKKVPFEDLSRLYSDYAGTEGRLSGSVHLAGALGSAGSLNGAGTATIEEGDVFTIPLFGPLSKLIRNVLPEGNKTGYSVAREAKATFRLENGVLKTEDLEALTNAFRFTGRGRVDCADKTVAFDAAVNTRFAPTRMLLTPVSKLLEYTCEGTLTEPKWRPSLTKGLKLPGNANLGGAAPAKDD